MIVDTGVLEDNLPQSVEAIFCVDCYNPERHKFTEYARKVHSDFVKEYSLASSDFPLVALDATNWKQPFSIFHQ